MCVFNCQKWISFTLHVIKQQHSGMTIKCNDAIQTSSNDINTNVTFCHQCPDFLTKARSSASMHDKRKQIGYWLLGPPSIKLTSRILRLLSFCSCANPTHTLLWRYRVERRYFIISTDKANAQQSVGLALFKRNAPLNVNCHLIHTLRNVYASILCYHPVHCLRF